jgi:phosphoglycerol transferase MdoB-like AlkP superfamily enzyme
LKRCFFALLILTISRLFFIIYLLDYFKNAPIADVPMVLFAGLLFDFQAIVYALGLFHLLSLLPFNFINRPKFQLSLRIIFTLGLSFIVLMNCIDTEFYKIKTRRSGIELFTMVGDPANSVGQYLIHYWWLLLVFILFVVAIYYFFPKFKTVQQAQKPFLTLLITLLPLSLLVLGARGGFYKKPIRSFDAARYVNAEWVSATINSPTQLLTSYNTLVPTRLNYYDNKTLVSIFNPIQTSQPYFKANDKPNIVLIILESFGRDYCGFLNGKQRYTPFLDSLAKQSISYTNAYSAGTTSMESIPAIFTSLPSLLDVPFINSNFQNNTLHGIHYYLNKGGYDCSFYYGADNGSMGFDNYLNINGPIDYFGLDEYPSPESDHDGSWGIWDEPYLQYFAKELGQKKGPFFSTVFTLSSHDPYKIPAQYKKDFKGGPLPIHRSVQYTDYALSQFFKTTKQQTWFKNTIFIITADHPSHSTDAYFYGPSGRYEIPLLIYSPKYFKTVTTDTNTVSHCDILPTILSFAGCKQQFFTFGSNLLDTADHFAINYANGILQLQQYPYCTELLPNNRVSMHEQGKDIPFKYARYILTEPEKELQLKMEKQLKARYQTYINALIDNQFFGD